MHWPTHFSSLYIHNAKGKAETFPYTAEQVKKRFIPWYNNNALQDQNTALAFFPACNHVSRLLQNSCTQLKKSGKRKPGEPSTSLWLTAHQEEEAAGLLTAIPVAGTRPRCSSTEVWLLLCTIVIWEVQSAALLISAPNPHVSPSHWQPCAESRAADPGWAWQKVATAREPCRRVPTVAPMCAPQRAATQHCDSNKEQEVGL